jgi:predicted Zn-ribbon and HTH transcriptional regulator
VSARELASRLGLREKDVADHLEHVARTLEARGARLAVEPAQCRACGFVFEHRARLTRPSRCPECKREQIEPPLFSAAH